MDDDELERIWNTLLWPNIGIFLEGLGKTTKSSRIANFMAGVGTKDIPNVNQEIYRYTTKFFES
jgi:hypothetical protein